MSEVEYSNLQVLIVDDYGYFRTTLSGMLLKLGFNQVEMASNGEDAVDLCQSRRFDLILCDYDLGAGKNGQQVLEELRFRALIPSSTLFLIVSADASKDVVMATYDCEADAYLMKPINLHLLEQRLTRLLQQRQALNPVYRALEVDRRAHAIDLLGGMSVANNRYSVTAQKLLGRLLIEEGELGKAELLLSGALQARPVDWARLGLARIKQLRGEHETAQEWLEQIIQTNPLCLPAYDALANNWDAMGLQQEVQEAVQRSVEVSPKSILRQKRLAQVAESNSDFATALGAWRTAVKLGELSCYAVPEDNLHFARIAAMAVDRKLESPWPLSQEAIDTLSQARLRYSLNHDQSARADLLEGRSWLAVGNQERARELIETVNAAHYDCAITSVALGVERVWALRALDDDRGAKRVLEQLLRQYASNQPALEQIDPLLEAPVSNYRREKLVKLNREGIDLYNRSRYDDAIACFERVQRFFPRHLGIQLNLVQALMGKCKEGSADRATADAIWRVLTGIQAFVDDSHPQFQRYRRLYDKARLHIVNQ